MPFEKFLINIQTMFTKLSENVEILSDSQKIRLISQKVENLILTQIKASLQVPYDLDQSNTGKYYFIANSMEAEATSLGNHTTQGVRDVNAHGKKAPESGVKGAGGAIFTGFYPNWSKLSGVEKQSILDERQLINIKDGGKRKFSDNKIQNRAASITFNNKAAQKIQRDISYLKTKCKKIEENRSASKESDEPQDNAGGHFGGRKGKKQQNKSD